MRFNASHLVVDPLVYSVGSGAMDFPEFLALMARKINADDTEDEMKEAFRYSSE